MILNRKVARVFKPLLLPARYKGAHGGRGSGKSHFFAEQLISDSLEEKGLRSICIREVQKSLRQSSKKLLEDKLQELGVGHEFRVFEKLIETPGDGVIEFQGMQDHTAESVKSLEGFKRAWIEEAQGLSDRSFTLLRPTIRTPGSQIWASWNPRRKTDAVDKFFRGGEKLPDAIVVQANWRDNPWLTDELRAERHLDLIRYPERYDHVWEGGYAKALDGAYFAKALADAKADGRIGNVRRDGVLPVRAFFDIGGSSKTSDATAVWIAQWIGTQIRVLDYIEGVNQPLGYYVDLLNQRGWGKALIYLPHDGVNENNVTGKRYEDHWREAGFDVTVIKNQGKGAALMRIEACRRLFPSCWFNEDTTEAGREALGFYHEKKDEARDVGLGPDHDWSSHGADAFGLMCVAYEEPRASIQQLNIPDFGAV